MNDIEITFEHEIELMLEKHTGDMSYDLAAAAIKKFGGTTVFEKTYKEVARYGMFDCDGAELEDWRNKPISFYEEHKADITEYIDKKTELQGYEYVSAMLHDTSRELACLDEDEIQDGLDGYYSKYHNAVLVALVNIIGEDLSHFCADYINTYVRREQPEPENVYCD